MSDELNDFSAPTQLKAYLEALVEAGNLDVIEYEDRKLLMLRHCEYCGYPAADAVIVSEFARETTSTVINPHILILDNGTVECLHNLDEVSIEPCGALLGFVV